MGAGKTTVGELLARRLGWRFVDLDLEIEALEHRSVVEIFREDGEAYFRRVERRCLETVSRGPGQVISLGGGAYVNPANRALVESRGICVYLEAPLHVLLGRIGSGAGRPLAGDRAMVDQLFASRQASYKMARMSIETEGRSPEDVVDGIVRALDIEGDS